MAEKYLKRIIDSRLDMNLRSFGAVLIEGPKWCGKTRTATEQSNSQIFMQDPDERKKNVFLVENKPSKILEGDTPRLIDEWQLFPILWDAIRFAVDSRNRKGQFIMTGSATPLLSDEEKRIMHTGTGRIARLRMRTMSLYESGDSDGSVSLIDLAEGKTDIYSESPHSIEDIAYLICRGGWPAATDLKKEESLNVAREYYNAVINADISEVDGIERNRSSAARLIRSIARNTSSPTPISVLARDISRDDNDFGISTVTVRSYLSALERLFVVEDLQAWTPSMRSKARVRSTPKRNLADPSISAAALGARPEGLLNDMSTFGLLFESMCIRDLRIYAEAHGGEVFFYRDNTDYEVDAIIDMGNGKWGAIEIKLNPGKEDKAATNLKRLLDKVDLGKMNPPAFLMVLTGIGFAHMRDDGVIVVPIGCLKD